MGQSLAGVATSVLSLVTVWASPPSLHEMPTAEDVSRPATLYFLACGLVVLLGILGYWILPHLQFVQHWTLKDGGASHRREILSYTSVIGFARVAMHLEIIIHF